MLITTHTGILVNSDHVATITLKVTDTDASEAKASGTSSPCFKTHLGLCSGAYVVAAAGMTREAAEFLRKDIAHHWAEGSASFDVNASLRRHLEGAYFASEAEERAETERR